ncbi:MAG: glycosyltransferase family 4 protein [Candidatus Omnitrophica bacterium]|nr:glycosyltransferase family 4 protein [Candidatus Omnitrophota bacterium]
MKILFLANHMEIGGVTSYTVNLAIAIKKRGIEVFVASSGGELVKALKKNDIPHLTVKVRTKFEFHPKLIFVFFKLLAFIKRNKIDIIHTNTRVTQVLAELLSINTGARHISTCHGFFRYKRIGRKLFGAWGRHVIAISEAVKDHLIKDFKVDKDKVSLIYNGVDTDAFYFEGKNGDNFLKENLCFTKHPVIGSIARLSPVKGLRYLLFAMKDLLKEIPEAELLLVGEGPSKEFLMGLAKKLGIEGSVFFAHSTTDTRRFLSIMDVFVFYSLEEGLGLSLLEAMASGKPCIASSVGGVLSIIEDGVTGLLVPPKDADSLKEAMIRLLKDRAFSSLLARNGREFVIRKFSIEKMTEEVIAVYKKVYAV